MRYAGHKFRMISLLLCVLLAISGCAGNSLPQQTVPHATQPIDVKSAFAREYELPEGAVVVTTVDEFIAAIAPDTTIVLADGEYSLAEAAGYPEQEEKFAPDWDEPPVEIHEYCAWENTMVDGYALNIHNVKNLTIMADRRQCASILALPRYADVLRFTDCEEIRLVGLTAGHSEGPGSCAGAVLCFEGCEGIRVEQCSLFGCGTWGILATQCERLLATESRIYDCSLGAVSLNECYNAQVERCEIDNCVAQYDGLLSFAGCTEVAVTNSSIHHNRGRMLVTSDYGSGGVYLGGLDVQDNTFSTGLYAAQADPIVFDGCSIDWFNQIASPFCAVGEFTDWYTPLQAVDAAGKELTDQDLQNMFLAEVTWEARERVAPAAAAPAEDGMVHVTTVDEFLAAIAPHTTIWLEDGAYDLSAASNYGRLGNVYYNWGQEFDGYTLEITGVEGLTIRGSGPEAVAMSAAARYADVLRLKNCSDFRLEGLNLGHTVEPGSCMGNVLELVDCYGGQVSGCSLYGCGVVGIEADRCAAVTVSATEIHHCEYDAVTLNSCDGFSFTDCWIHDNGVDRIYHSDSSNITVNSEPVPSGN